MGSNPLVTSFSVVIKARPLGEGFATIQTSIGFVTGMHSRVSFQSRRFSKSFTTYFTAIGTLAVVFSSVTEHGGLVSKLFLTHGTLERFFTRMLTEMVVQVDPGLEGFVTRRTREVANVFVVRPHMGGQPAGFAKSLATMLASNLASDTVGPEMVAKGVAIGILLGTDVAFRLLAFVG